MLPYLSAIHNINRILTIVTLSLLLAVFGQKPVRLTSYGFFITHLKNNNFEKCTFCIFGVEFEGSKVYIKASKLVNKLT
jgi:hypothetical protein